MQCLITCQHIHLVTAEVAAVLLAEPDNTFLYEGTGLVAQCVAYGSPKPQITWSSQDLRISNFETTSSNGATTTVITQDADVDGLIVTFSTLHICPSMFDTLTSYFVDIECSTTNGLSSPLGVQSGSFVADPFSELLLKVMTVTKLYICSPVNFYEV